MVEGSSNGVKEAVASVRLARSRDLTAPTEGCEGGVSVCMLACMCATLELILMLERWAAWHSAVRRVWGEVRDTPVA